MSNPEEYERGQKFRSTDLGGPTIEERVASLELRVAELAAELKSREESEAMIRAWEKRAADKVFQSGVKA